MGAEVGVRLPEFGGDFRVFHKLTVVISGQPTVEQAVLNVRPEKNHVLERFRPQHGDEKQALVASSSVKSPFSTSLFQDFDIDEHVRVGAEEVAEEPSEVIIHVIANPFHTVSQAIRIFD